MVSATATKAPAPIRAKSLVSIASVPEHLGGGRDIAASRREEAAKLFTRLRLGRGRIGGIEKKQGTGNIDYSPANHQEMTDTRKAKISGIRVADQAVETGEAGAKLVVVGWGSTFGPIHQAVRRKRAEGLDVSHIHIRHIWPLPTNLGELLKSFDKVIVPEMNTGQLKTVLRDQYLVDAKPVNKVSGQPFTIAEIEAAIEEALG